MLEPGKEMAALESRMARTEEQVNALNQSLNAHLFECAKTNANLTTRMDTLEKSVGQLADRIWYVLVGVASAAVLLLAQLMIDFTKAAM